MKIRVFFSMISLVLSFFVIFVDFYHRVSVPIVLFKYCGISVLAILLVYVLKIVTRKSNEYDWLKRRVGVIYLFGSELLYICSFIFCFLKSTKVSSFFDLAYQSNGIGGWIVGFFVVETLKSIQKYWKSKNIEDVLFFFPLSKT